MYITHQSAYASTYVLTCARTYEYMYVHQRSHHDTFILTLRQLEPQFSFPTLGRESSMIAIQDHSVPQSSCTCLQTYHRKRTDGLQMQPRQHKTDQRTLEQGFPNNPRVVRSAPRYSALGCLKNHRKHITCRQCQQHKVPSVAPSSGARPSRSHMQRNPSGGNRHPKSFCCSCCGRSIRLNSAVKNHRSHHNNTFDH